VFSGVAGGDGAAGYHGSQGFGHAVLGGYELLVAAHPFAQRFRWGAVGQQCRGQGGEAGQFAAVDLFDQGFP
jgi:hypothetical protein